MRWFLLFIAPFLWTTIACYWDYDSLAMERAHFPDVHELIVGHFPRHSAAYYQWRIKDRLKIPEAERTPATYDDLAVAYDKLGQHETAIQTIEQKLERWPDTGKYESLANLGTFYFHSGQLEAGLPYIQKAIEINPDAHFGREIYQQLLVQYVLQQRAAGKSLPLADDATYRGFTGYVLEQRGKEDSEEEKEIQAAVKGVAGMMRFGNYQSPILQEAMGDLLVTNHSPRRDSKMLAARCYLQAANYLSDRDQANAYREKAKAALDLQDGRELEEIEQELVKERNQAESFAVEIAAQEAVWIAADQDVDRLFQSRYYAAPELVLEDPDKRFLSINTKIFFVATIFLLFIFAVFLVGFYVLVRRIRKNLSKPSATETAGATQPPTGLN